MYVMKLSTGTVLPIQEIQERLNELAFKQYIYELQHTRSLTQ